MTPSGDKSTISCAETLTVGSHSSGRYLAMFHGQEAGTMDIVLDFCPNHLDLSWLSRDCILDSALPKALLEQLVQSVRSELSSDQLNDSSYFSAIEKSIQRLRSSLDNNKLAYLLSKHLNNSNNTDDSVSIQSNSLQILKEGEIAATLTATNNGIESVPYYKADACAKQYLRYLLRDFKQVNEKKRNTLAKPFKFIVLMSFIIFFFE